ncbi:hypothetical protein P43SY_008756 [Pythium insidiosum]|uniref:Cysteine-rich protein n=1 Tax=Pythium insidiosum TaxID=114742 RepID=A0AAD5LCB3_PYTIN|nr:hypothetical protein P43SY_008756 [Pythium insidiosum]
MRSFLFMTALAFVAAGGVSAEALARTQKPGNDSMSVGDGTFVKSKTNSTVFLGTEYNPDRCKLQFASIECSATNCGEINGYKLECVELGKQNGKIKKSCRCKAAEQEVCQNSTAPAIEGVPQFGDCTGGKRCIDSFGHVDSALERRICAEKLHCVKEVNTTATKPAEICHTCRSCIAQNDKATDSSNKGDLSDLRRFDCRKICPKEILDSIERRNKKGVGIADELGSDSGSSEAEEEEEGSEEGSSSPVKSSGSGSKAAGKKNAAPGAFSVSAAVGSAVAVVLSAALAL